jgi:hypothetical protein
VLPPERFVRIHRAYVMSLDWIHAFDNHTGYGPDQTLPIREAYRDHFLGRIPVFGGQEKKPVS